MPGVAYDTPVSGISSQEIDRVEEHVQCQLSGRVRDLRLLRRGHGLVLQGHAHTYYAKQLAQHAVMAATQLPIIANEIQVS
jgi:hypothetical protein